MGKRQTCANCGGVDLEGIPLSRRGKLWTYTIIRHKPPGDYKGPDPFVPFGLGMVQLPEGIRVMSPIQCELEKIKIGMELEMEVYPLYTDENQNQVMAFRFRPV
ncbi:MAG: Zn-ribbon domain-containing OB-fold protein [Planctomycetaceae bacterium]